MVDLFSDTVIALPVGICKATLYSDFISKNSADDCFKELLISTPWTQETIKFKGNVHPVPRLTAWYSKIGRDYSYSGIRAKAEPYTPLLASINQKVETIANREFNSVLLNYYRNGHD